MILAATAAVARHAAEFGCIVVAGDVRTGLALDCTVRVDNPAFVHGIEIGHPIVRVEGLAQELFFGPLSWL